MVTKRVERKVILEDPFWRFCWIATNTTWEFQARKRKVQCLQGRESGRGLGLSNWTLPSDGAVAKQSIRIPLRHLEDQKGFPGW
jgi:hypothetical protein